MSHDKEVLMPRTEVRTRQDLAKVIEELGLKKGVEIGVHEGDFSAYLLEQSFLDILYSVDAWLADEEATHSVQKRWSLKQKPPEECYRKTCERLAKFGARSKVIRSLSEKAADEFQDGSLDFIYVDASHRFTGVALDLIKWWPKLREGGIFAGHDYWRCYRYEVMEAVNGFLVEHKQILDVTTDELNHKGEGHYPPTWWCIKRAMRKAAWNSEVARILPELRRKQKLLMEKKGVRIILPYQYLHPDNTEDAE